MGKSSSQRRSRILKDGVGLDLGLTLPSFPGCSTDRPNLAPGRASHSSFTIVSHTGPGAVQAPRVTAFSSGGRTYLTQAHSSGPSYLITEALETAAVDICCLIPVC